MTTQTVPAGGFNLMGLDTSCNGRRLAHSDQITGTEI